MIDDISAKCRLPFKTKGLTLISIKVQVSNLRKISFNKKDNKRIPACSLLCELEKDILMERRTKPESEDFDYVPDAIPDCAV